MPKFSKNGGESCKGEAYSQTPEGEVAAAGAPQGESSGAGAKPSNRFVNKPSRSL